MMKQSWLLVVLSFSVVSSSPAASCVTGSLASYIALGSGGCTIGGDTLANFQALGGSAGATQLAATAVTIMPLGGTFDPGISATVSVTATGSTTDETMFSYSISGPTYKSESITLSNSSETGAGGVSDVQNFCQSSIGTFVGGVYMCSGASGSLLTVDGVQNQDSTGFASPHFLSVTDDFTLAGGGLGGSATGGKITDQFTAVPEPAPLWITVFGVAFATVLKSRFRAAARFRGKGGNA